MATYVRDYSLTINACVSIEADSEDEARELFDMMERSDKSWFYFKNEIFDHMGEYVGNNVRDVVMDIETDGTTYQDEEYQEDVIDHERYL